MSHILQNEQANSKIQGKFYPLQREEWLYACRELTQAQLAVLYYIRTTDPYNQGIDINCAQIARLLSTPERIVHRQTVSRALKELDEKRFIDLELLQVKAKVKAKGIWCGETPGCDETPGCNETPQVIATHRDRSPRTTIDHYTPRLITTHQAKPETSTEEEFPRSKINKTNLDSLSDMTLCEREDFEKFVREEYLRTEGKKIRSFTAFMQREHFQEWYALWKNRPDAVKALQNALWESDERRQEWLDKIRILGFMGFICENGFKDLERLAFYEWAEEKGIIWEAEL